MIASSDAYKKAISAATRRIVAKSIINIIDPDITYSPVTSSAVIPYSNPQLVMDKDISAQKIKTTLELNRWGLNGKQSLYVDTDEQPFISNVLSSGDLSISGVWVQLNMTNLSVLQACSVYFNGNAVDGVAVDFTVQIYSGDTIAWEQSVTDNSESIIYFEGFTAYDVTAIRVTPTKWSKPYYRARIIEIIPGLYEEWEGDTIYAVDVMQQADFSCLSLPYSTATLEIRNETRRFDPRNKNGLFLSIEERQAIPIQLGVVSGDDIEYMPIGTFYQQTGGWSISSNGLIITWSLVDIIGLLSQRKYEPPSELPTTLSGWLASLVAQLGDNFTSKYLVDEALGNTELTCDAADVENVTCGNLLRWVCQAAGAYPIADAETGCLSAKLLSDTVTNRVSLRYQNDYPTISANTDIAAITFKIGDTQYTVPGTSTSASKTVSIANPFIHSTEQAQAAAKNILINYGGNKITSRERGDMSNEIGDINSVEVIPSSDMPGRRIKQQFKLSNGVMTNVPSYFVQATGNTLYDTYEIITDSGTWTAPNNITSIYLILVGGGAGGDSGTDGTWDEDGTPGQGGAGGKVFAQTIAINPGQQSIISIGEGGAPGMPGGETTFGQSYSSANGQEFDGYAILAISGIYGQSGESGTGVAGAENTGNGGGGGAAGLRGVTGTDGSTTIIGRYPTPGAPGASGGSGVAIIMYSKSGA